MGLMGQIGKMAASKIVETGGDLLTKKPAQNQEKKREQVTMYCKYVFDNIDRIYSLIADLENDTKVLVDNINSMENMKVSFREKASFKKNKEKTQAKAKENLRYLYLARDFFAILAKSTSGVLLKNEELLLIDKFAPFFDGIPVLDINEKDDSLLGELKEIKEEFVSSKKDPNYFEFDNYLSRYQKNLAEYIIPDTKGAVENFKKSIAAQKANNSPISKPTQSSNTPTTLSKEIECSNCHTKLRSGSNFCPACGNKIEIKKARFCTQCGEPIIQNMKFCSNCGFKI